MKKFPWKTLSSKIVYENPWYKVRQDEVIRPNGEQSKYDVVVTPPSVMIIALTEENEFYLVGLSRYPTGIYAYEVPAGGSEGEDLLEAAKRELEEEAGLIANSWEKIGEFAPFNGIASEISYVFLAKDLSNSDQHKMHEEGIDDVIKVSFKRAFEMIKSGEIADGQCISAIIFAAIHLGKIGVNG